MGQPSSTPNPSQTRTDDTWSQTFPMLTGVPPSSELSSAVTEAAIDTILGLQSYALTNRSAPTQVAASASLTDEMALDPVGRFCHESRDQPWNPHRMSDESNQQQLNSHAASSAWDLRNSYREAGRFEVESVDSEAIPSDSGYRTKGRNTESLFSADPSEHELRDTNLALAGEFEKLNPLQPSSGTASQEMREIAFEPERIGTRRQPSSVSTQSSSFACLDHCLKVFSTRSQLK